MRRMRARQLARRDGIDKPRVTCPHCGSARMRRVMSGEKFETTV